MPATKSTTHAIADAIAADSPGLERFEDLHIVVDFTGMKKPPQPVVSDDGLELDGRLAKSGHRLP